MNNEFFVNDRYHVLKILYENQVTIGENVFTPITQEELATMTKWSKAKVNKVLNELIDNGYVTVFSRSKGRYQITESGLDIMKD
ncbi:MAG: helix-turn-helix domain-containing protein [Oribacterium sp.]|nr:helix-turn-helix domain-containing protein [Oribacterium sp.]